MSSIGGAPLGRQAGKMLDRMGLSSELAKVLATAESGLGLERSMKGLLQKLEEGFQAAGVPGQGAGPAAPALSPGIMEKVLYLSVLRGAIQKATQSHHFNLETQINDLWVKLSQLRQNRSNKEFLKLQELFQQRQESSSLLSRILKQYSDTAQSLISNMK
jgi:hypothetical protein